MAVSAVLGHGEICVTYSAVLLEMLDGSTYI